jgi:hypothetical protein
MYLPRFHTADGGDVFDEGVVAIDRADLLHLDLVRRLERVTQLTLIARQQLNRKLVFADTGFHNPFEAFTPDLD